MRTVPVDELQVHWYDRRAPQLYPANASRGVRGLTSPDVQVPVLLGEFPTKGSAAAPAEVVASARRLGYSGALGWSALATDGYTDLAALERAL